MKSIYTVVYMFSVDQLAYSFIYGATDSLYTAVFSFATHLFDPIQFTALALLSAFLLYRVYGLRSALLLVASVVLAFLLSLVVKYTTVVTRPVSSFLFESSPSFPSSHATVATAYFLTLLHFFRKDKNKWRRALHVVFCVLSATFVGVSRLYLGVHWLSDVIAGYILGGLVVFVCVTVYNKRYAQYESTYPRR